MTWWATEPLPLLEILSPKAARAEKGFLLPLEEQDEGALAEVDSATDAWTSSAVELGAGTLDTDIEATKVFETSEVRTMTVEDEPRSAGDDVVPSRLLGSFPTRVLVALIDVEDRSVVT